ncbi:hypothetical protein [Kribbella sp. NPDC006257]|uniref:hypothetical protein n=1 Tax=Kribbella sp. NPDC006257 TaxID=3156738 RepID=UPI0033A9866B
MPRFHPAHTIPLAFITLLGTTTSATALTPAAAASAADPTPAVIAAAGCDAGAVGFTPVLQINLPVSANWLNKTPPYSVNNTATIGAFDRVGYCLELNGPKGV